MAPKRRKSKRKKPITDAECAWLIGDSENDGFTSFEKPGDDDYQFNLWRDHGDKRRFRWEPGMYHPEEAQGLLPQN
jgi:hypothetical protein